MRACPGAQPGKRGRRSVGSRSTPAATVIGGRPLGAEWRKRYVCSRTPSPCLLCGREESGSRSPREGRGDTPGRRSPTPTTRQWRPNPRLRRRQEQPQEARDRRVVNGTRAQEQDVGFECRTRRSGADFSERSSVGVGSELAGARRVCQVLMAGAGGGGTRRGGLWELDSPLGFSLGLKLISKMKSIEKAMGQFESLRPGRPALSVTVPLVQLRTPGFVIPVGPSSLSM